MGMNVTQKLIAGHLVEGRMQPGEETALKIDQALMQDATGTLVMLEFEALGIPRVRTELAVQYVDHNLLQEDFKNPRAGCGGCIGMGAAPASGRISLRTVPRNFPGRSGTKEDQVYLCSPETAAASALTGQITDPRTLGRPYPRFDEPETLRLNTEMLVPPPAEGTQAELEMGPNIQPLPELEPLPEKLEGPVLLKLKDNVSTDEILPADIVQQDRS